jgi:hypothetical protein
MEDETMTEIRTTLTASAVSRTLAITVALLMAPLGDALAQTFSREALPPPGAILLEGTWKARITLRDCLTGEAMAPSFPAMVSFARGGTMTTADGGLSPAQRGPGHGSWRHTGAHTYSAISEAFLFAPTGVMVGTQRLSQEIELSPDRTEFHSKVSASILAPNGTQIAAGCASSEGRRLQ